MFLLFAMVGFAACATQWIALSCSFFTIFLFLFIIRYKLVDAVMKCKHALHLKVMFKSTPTHFESMCVSSMVATLHFAASIALNEAGKKSTPTCVLVPPIALLTWMCVWQVAKVMPIWTKSKNIRVWISLSAFKCKHKKNGKSQHQIIQTPKVKNQVTDFSLFSIPSVCLTKQLHSELPQFNRNQFLFLRPCRTNSTFLFFRILPLCALFHFWLFFLSFVHSSPVVASGDFFSPTI